MDFSKLTACGGDCSDCLYYQRKNCCGCRQNGGTCVKMWQNGCEICKCCQEHDVQFCGLCSAFPCTWLQNTLTWDKNGIERLEILAEEYHRRRKAILPTFSLLWDKIGTHGVMTLSISFENHVTSRAMSIVIFHETFYCQTDEISLKCQQIQKNSNVALCYQNFSIEGTCCIVGKPYENPIFIQFMREHFPNTVERWSAFPTECLLAIKPLRIASWSYEEDKPYMEYWDFQNLSYSKEGK